MIHSESCYRKRISISKILVIERNSRKLCRLVLRAKRKCWNQQVRLIKFDSRYFIVKFKSIRLWYTFSFLGNFSSPNDGNSETSLKVKSNLTWTLKAEGNLSLCWSKEEPFDVHLYADDIWLEKIRVNDWRFYQLRVKR